MKSRPYIYLALLIQIIIWGLTPIQAKKKELINDISISFSSNFNNVSRRFGNLDYGLRIEVHNEVDDYHIVDLKELPTKEVAIFPQVHFDQSLLASTEQILYEYASSLGFDMSSDFESSYILSVTIKDCSLKVRAFNPKRNEFRSSGAVIIRWELLDPDHKPVIGPMTSSGHATANTQQNIGLPVREAYLKAIEGIDWNRIAPALKISKRASQEKNKQVSGAGNTALEHSVIRWYIISKPQGADVTWRVISSTPDVANTNGNYVGTTPYESTESFDIRGLTYNNSGNVQIEITCEKPGYIPQKKRFNLKQAIDQKEISAKFTLVKESEEDE